MTKDPRLHPMADFCGSYVDEHGVERFLGMLPRYPETMMPGEPTRRVWTNPPNDRPNDDAVWSDIEGRWLESDDAFRRRVKETMDAIHHPPGDLSDQCNIGDIQAPSVATIRRELGFGSAETHEAKMLVSLELLHKLLELPDNVQITAVSTKMINRVPTMALHLEGPAHLLEHGSWVKAVYSHKTKFDCFQKEEPPIPDPFAPKPQIIHLLIEGRTPCRMPVPSSTWPQGQRWAWLEEWEKAVEENFIHVCGTCNEWFLEHGRAMIKGVKPEKKDCHADPVNGGCDCCNRTGMVQEGMISMPCHCLEKLR